MSPQQEFRRRFLQFLAASPLAAASPAALAQALPRIRETDPRMWAPYDPQHLITDPKEAINVFDFEPVCRQKVPPAHFGYMASGIDDEVTLRANREDFLKLQLRPRRLVDVSKVDMSVDILGTRYPSPIIVAPIGGQRSFHAEGEIATAKAAKAGNHLMILSTDHQRRRGCDGGARCAGVVPALRHQQMGRGEGHGAARRESRLSSGGSHRRPFRRPQPGDAFPPDAQRHPQLRRLPRPL